MDRASDDLLSRSRLARDENGRLRMQGHVAGLIDHRGKRKALRNDNLTLPGLAFLEDLDPVGREEDDGRGHDEEAEDHAEGPLDRHHDGVGLGGVLLFVGIKMLISDFYHVPILVSLGVIVGLLAIAVVASLLIPEKERAEEAEGAEKGDMDPVNADLLTRAAERLEVLKVELEAEIEVDEERKRVEAIAKAKAEAKAAKVSASHNQTVFATQLLRVRSMFVCAAVVT